MQNHTWIGLSLAGVLLVAPGASAQNQPPPPGVQATIPSPTPGPPDPALRVVKLPNGKRMHMLPATLETTQWGWFDNAQPPVMRVNSGDTIVLETMMHSHNQIVPARRSSKSRRRARTFRGADRTR